MSSAKERFYKNQLKKGKIDKKEYERIISAKPNSKVAAASVRTQKELDSLDFSKRTQGQSRREFLAQKAGGRLDYKTGQITIPKKVQSSKEYGYGRGTWNPDLTEEEKKQADSFLEQLKRNTVINSQGQGMSVVPERQASFQQSKPQLSEQERQQADNFLANLGQQPKPFLNQPSQVQPAQPAPTFFQKISAFTKPVKDAVVNAPSNLKWAFSSPKNLQNVGSEILSGYTKDELDALRKQSASEIQKNYQQTGKLDLNFRDASKKLAEAQVITVLGSIGGGKAAGLVDDLVKANTKEAVQNIAKKTGVKLENDAAEAIAKTTKPEEINKIIKVSENIAQQKQAISEIVNGKPKVDTIQSSKKIKPLGQQMPKQSQEKIQQGLDSNSYNGGIPNNGDLVNTTTGAGKSSKFAQRVAEKTPKPLSDQLKEVSYSANTNKEVISRAKNIIAQNEDEALKIARQENSTDANAVATELIGKYLKEGQFEKAAQLTKEVSPRFSRQGQQIQILSQYGKLTPEGASRYMQRIVDEANEKLPTAKKIKLSPQDFEQVAGQAEKIQGMQEGTREYAVEVAKLMDQFSSKVPVSVGQKISTIQTMAQLLNPKTAIRNLGGNAFLAGIENASDTVATGVDKILSKTLFEGQKSFSLPSLKAQSKGAKEGFKLGLEDALLGIDTGAHGTQFDLPTKTFRGGILGALEKGLNIELKAADRAFYKAAYDGSLESMLKANKLAKPTAEMEARAGQEALYRTFQNNSKLAEVLSGLKKQLNKVGTPGGEFGLGDIINKYPKTPANIVSVGIDYSPFGLIKAANNIIKVARGVEGKTIGNQREIAQNISRALTGSGLISMGYTLAKNGIITGQKEKDIDINQQYRQTGQGPFKINIDALQRLVNGKDAAPKNGDTLVSYDWLQPNAIQFSMGANMAIGAKSATDQLNTAVEGLASGVDTLTQQPVISGVSNFFRTVTQTGGVAGVFKGLENAATTAPASFVPSLFNQMAQLRDNVARSTYDPSSVQESINKVKQRIPGFRETLNPQVGTNGKELEQYQNNTNSIFNVMFNPAFVSKINETPDAKLVLDIYERSGETQQAPRLQQQKVSVNGKQTELSADQLTQMQKFIGEETTKAFEKLASSNEFNSLSDEDKAKKMSNIMTDIGKLAKVNILGDKGTTKTAEQIQDSVTVSQETLKSFSQIEPKRELYEQYQEKLKSNAQDADKFLRSMDYPTYEKFKKQRTSARTSNTRQFKEYLASDDPKKAVDFIDSLDKAEQKRILNAMTPTMRSRYLEGKK